MGTPINLSTAGVTFSYAVEATAGTRPTTSYKEIEGIKSTPSLNAAPDALETTTLNATEWKEYIDGLKDPGGALEFGFNLTQNLIDKWDTLMEDYTAGKTSGKRTWFCITIPGLTKSYYFPGNPSALGLPEMAVNSVLETVAYVTPTGAPISAAKPTA